MKRPHLSRRLWLEAPVRAEDGAGGQSVAWVTLGSLWAEVKPRTGREVVFGAQERSIQPVRITVRAAPPGAPSRPEADQRFRDGARIFAILAVTEADAEGMFLTCFAEEGRLP